MFRKEAMLMAAGLCTAASVAAETPAAASRTASEAAAEHDMKLISLNDSLQPLIDRFNANKDNARLVALFSPT